MLAMYLRTGRIHHLSTFLTNCFVFPWLWSSSGDTWPEHLIRWLLLQPLVEIYHINMILTRFWHMVMPLHSLSDIYLRYIFWLYWLYYYIQPMDDQIFSLSYIQISLFGGNFFCNCYIEMIMKVRETTEEKELRKIRGMWPPLHN